MRRGAIPGGQLTLMVIRMTRINAQIKEMRAFSQFFMTSTSPPGEVAKPPYMLQRQSFTASLACEDSAIIA